MLVRACLVLGLQAVGVAVGWQVYALTGRALDLGLVGLVQFVPTLLLWPLTGLAADRLPRRGLLLACTAVELVAVLGLALLEPKGTTPIFAVLVLLAVGRVFAWPVSASILPTLVEPAQLPRAVTLASGVVQVCLTAGPALGGLVYAWAGAAQAVYMLAAVLLCTAFILGFTLPAAPPAGGGPVDLAGGLRFIASRPVVLGAISLDLFAVLLGGAVALLPIFARDILDAGPEALGALRAAPAVGAACMAFALSRWPIRHNAGRTLFLAVALFGATTIGFGLSRSIGLSLLLLALGGAADEISVIVRHSLVQLRTPNELRGRVSAVNFLFIGMSNEVGELESGLTAAWFGPVHAVLLGGVGTLVVVALFWLFSPSLRNVDKLNS